MAHNVRIYSDAGWVVGMSNAGGVTPSNGDIDLIDGALGAAVNGDGGGTWYPAATLTIGGAGLALVYSTAHELSGSTADVTGPISFGDNDYDVLGSGHTGASRAMVDGDYSDVSNWQHTLGFGPYPTGTQPGAVIWKPVRVHHGATLSAVVFEFQVFQGHWVVPQNLPTFRLLQVDAYGTITNLLAAGVPVAFSPAPASGTAWHDSGAIQTFSPTVASGVVFDVTKYTYWAEFVDESGAGAYPNGVGPGLGNLFIDVKVSVTGIPDARPE